MSVGYLSRLSAQHYGPSGQPADYRDDEVDLVDVDDSELDLLDDLDEWED